MQAKGFARKKNFFTLPVEKPVSEQSSKKVLFWLNRCNIAGFARKKIFFFFFTHFVFSCGVDMTTL